jgi:cell division protein FtsW
MRKIEYNKPTIDISLLGCVIILIGIGAGILYTASQPVAARYFNGQHFFITKQAAFILIGIIAFLFGAFINHTIYAKYIKIIILGTFVLLIITLIPGIGKEVAGARRWINIMGFQFQPSEAAKLAVIFYLSSVLTNKKEHIKDFYKGVLPPFIIVTFICFLVLLENDFSTTFLILVLAIIIFFLAGIRLSTFFMIVVVGAFASTLMIIFAAYRVKRIFAFINPWADPLGSGWHYIQSMKCFAFGKIFGKGIGESSQKYFALPEAHTDYIYAIIGEEGGAFLASFVILLYLFFAFVGFNIAKRCEDTSSYLLACGITALIFFQAVMNIGVVIGILPATGITLPFISYGGTSLIVFMYCVGILINISHKSKISGGGN